MWKLELLDQAFVKRSISAWQFYTKTTFSLIIPDPKINPIPQNFSLRIRSKLPLFSKSESCVWILLRAFPPGFLRGPSVSFFSRSDDLTYGNVRIPVNENSLN